MFKKSSQEQQSLRNPMMVWLYLFGLFFSFAVDGFSSNDFFVFDNGVGRGTWAPEKQARVLKELGYDGISYNLTTQEALAHWQRAFNDEGLKIYGLYVRTYVDGARRYQDELREAIEVLKGSDTIIWMTIEGGTNQRGELDRQAVENVCQVADWAAQAGLRVVIYPHVNYYVETAEDALRIYRQFDRNNVAISFNLYHELRFGNRDRLNEIINKTAPYLELVSINGSDIGTPRDNKILDAGTFDVLSVLGQFKAVGYTGPIGLQCWALPGDDRENLALSMAAWRRLTQRLSIETQTPAEWVALIDRERILKLAESYMSIEPISLRDYPAPADYVGPGDFYSMGDYWWPNPDTEDGLPYVRRDGQSNPGNFVEHRMAVRRMRDAVAALGAAYALHGNDIYAEKAVELLDVFFLAEDRRMNPHLLYAQAIPGRTKGRGIGIIDTLHLAEVPLAIEVLESSSAMTPEVLEGLKQWFADYADWLTTHPQGLAEMNTTNNHAVAYFVQLVTFARLSGKEDKLDLARHHFKEIIMPSQMAPDGSFPRELSRTKPYGYSIFQLDNMSLLSELLSTEDDSLWTFTLPNGRGMKKAMDFLFPYLKDKSRWPYREDIEHYEDWPVRQPCLLLGGYAFGRPDYLALWETLDPDPTDLEVQRNMAVTQPLLWIIKSEEVPML